MYTKYGKACRSKKSSKSSTAESEKSGKSNDPEVKTDEAKSDSNENDDNVEDTGADNEGNADDEEEEQEKEGNSPRQRRASVHFHAKDQKPTANSTDENDEKEMSKDDDENENVEDESESTTGDVVENADDESSEDAGGAGGPDENDQSDESEAFDVEASTDNDDVASKKKFKKVKPVMEYDIKNMYPDIEILVQKKKREWDFQDPDIIRALWLEAKTQVLTEWKIRNAKIKIDKPSFEVRETYTVKLRHKHFQEEADRKADSEIREIKMTVPGRVPPQLGKLEINTNLTFDMRYKYNRNNPPVPSHYIEHFEKFKRPPFDNNATRYVF